MLESNELRDRKVIVGLLERAASAATRRRTHSSIGASTRWIETSRRRSRVENYGDALSIQAIKGEFVGQDALAVRLDRVRFSRQETLLVDVGKGGQAHQTRAQLKRGTLSKAAAIVPANRSCRVTRTYEAHVATEYIPELWQFVEFLRTQPRTDPRNARVGARRHARMRSASFSVVVGRIVTQLPDDKPRPFRPTRCCLKNPSVPVLNRAETHPTTISGMLTGRLSTTKKTNKRRLPPFQCNMLLIPFAWRRGRLAS